MTVGVSGGPLRDAKGFPSTRWYPVPGATRTTLGFGICPSFKGHSLSPRSTPQSHDSQLFHRLQASQFHTSPCRPKDSSFQQRSSRASPPHRPARGRGSAHPADTCRQPIVLTSASSLGCVGAPFLRLVVAGRPGHTACGAWNMSLRRLECAGRTYPSALGELSTTRAALGSCHELVSPRLEGAAAAWLATVFVSKPT